MLLSVAEIYELRENILLDFYIRPHYWKSADIVMDGLGMDHL